MKNFKSYIYCLFPISFFGFVCWIIYMANMGINSIFFQLVRGIPYGDKLGHFIIYGVLAMLFNLAINCRTFRFCHVSWQMGGFLVFTFAFIEELTQYFFPSRNLDYVDLLANLIGILLFNYLSRRIKKKYLAEN